MSDPISDMRRLLATLERPPPPPTALLRWDAFAAQAARDEAERWAMDALGMRVVWLGKPGGAS